MTFREVSASCTKILLMLSATVLLFSGVARSQDTLHSRYGLYLHDNLNFHTSSFTSFPGYTSCCPGFETGFGMGLGAGFVYEYPLNPFLLLSTRAGLYSLNGSLTRDESTTVIDPQGNDVPGVFTHTVHGSIMSYALEPLLSYPVFTKLFLHGGLHFGLISGTGTFSEQEEITQPSFGTFVNEQSRIRNKYDNKPIPGLNKLTVGLVLGASYELPLNKKGTMLAAPEVLWNIPFNSVATWESGHYWKVMTVSAGVSIKYAPKPYVPPPFQYDTVYRRDTVERVYAFLTAPKIVLLSTQQSEEHSETDDARIITTIFDEHYERQIPPPPKPKLGAGLQAVGLESDGKESPVGQMRIEEFLGEQFHPLLPFVFFEPGDAALPARYRKLSKDDAESFSEKDMYDKPTLVAYDNMLNIIGRRLRDKPKASITLTGCNDGMPEDLAVADLSKQRAETVKNYLTSAWGINGSRVAVKYRGKPELPSNPTAVDGQEENRRVEISASDPTILDIVHAHDTLRKANPPSIRFKPTVKSDTGIKNWEIHARQNNHTWKTFEGTGTPPAEVNWNLGEDQKNVPRFDSPVEGELTVVDNADQVEHAKATLPMEQITVQKKRDTKVSDMTIDVYNLLLFDYSKATLGPANQRTVDMIRSRLQPASAVHMQGFTDRTGNDVSNRKLATDRAKNVLEALHHPNASFDGIGSTESLYPNNTPEGRMYSRTVQVTVETPVK